MFLAVLRSIVQVSVSVSTFGATTWDKVSARTKVNLRRYPLAFISNRWGSIEATELFFLERGREILQAVFLAVLSRFMKASKEKVSSNAATDGTGGSGSSMPLMDNEEDAVHYQLKLSKWANGAFVAIQNSLFWLLLRVVNTARQPLSAFYFFMKNIAMIDCFSNWPRAKENFT